MTLLSRESIFASSFEPLIRSTIHFSAASISIPCQPETIPDRGKAHNKGKKMSTRKNKAKKKTLLIRKTQEKTRTKNRWRHKSSGFIKLWNTSAVSSTDYTVDTQLCNLRSMSCLLSHFYWISKFYDEPFARIIYVFPCQRYRPVTPLDAARVL